MATGSTISAAISSTPTMRIAITTVTAVSTASIALSARAGTPATRAESSSSTTASRARPVTAIAATITAPSAITVHTSLAVAVRIDPNRYGWRLALVAERLASTTPAAMPP